MFSSLLLLLTAALTLIVLGVRAADDSKAPHTHRWRRLKNLVDECAFTLGETNFNLCPVVNGNEGGWSVEYERKTPPTITKTSYRIDLKAPLKRDEKVNQYDQVSRLDFLAALLCLRLRFFCSSHLLSRLRIAACRTCNRSHAVRGLNLYVSICLAITLRMQA